MEIEKVKSLLEQAKADEKIKNLEDAKLRKRLSDFFAEDQNVTVVSDGIETKHFVPRIKKDTAKELANYYVDMLKYYDKYTSDVKTGTDGKNRFYFKKNDEKKSEIKELNEIASPYLKSKSKALETSSKAKNINDDDIKACKKAAAIAKRQQAR